ncbi:ATP-binding protein [Candidatus Woesearchaeota archaeon]|nr:ATP-binding protein [Candidatus Woesearchaeota archaeon]
MNPEKSRYISIAVQNPSLIHLPISERGDSVTEIGLQFVNPSEKQVSIFADLEDTGLVIDCEDFQIDDTEKYTAAVNEVVTFRGDPIIQDMRISMAGDGYEYVIGGYLRTQRLFRQKDIERLPIGFPLHGVDLGDFILSLDHHKEKDGLIELGHIFGDRDNLFGLSIGINADLEGNLQREITEKVRQEAKGFLGRKKIAETTQKKSRMARLPDDMPAKEVIIIDNLVRICQTLERGVNSVFTYLGEPIKSIGEVQVAYMFSRTDDVIFHYDKGLKGVAKSYDIRDYQGTKLYCYHPDPGTGHFKIGSFTDVQQKAGSGTSIEDKPKSAQILKPHYVQKKPDTRKAEDSGIVTLDDVVGAVEAKKELMRACNHFKNPERYREFGITPKAGVLLHGPSGTGKTLLARAMANDAEAKFLLCESYDILSKFSGESENNLGNLLREAAKYDRCILIIDEFDALGRKREMSDSSSHGTEARIVNILLGFLDGFKKQDNVYMIGTTNRLDVIDGAIIQRLDTIYVPLPDLEARAELVRRRTERYRSDFRPGLFGEIDYNAIAKASEGLSGRDLVGEKRSVFSSLLYKAEELSVNQGKGYILTTKDWLDEIERSKPKPSGPRIGFKKY